MEVPPSDNLWIGGLPNQLDKPMLMALLGPYGNIADCRVLPPKQEGMTSSAMVRFSSVEEASWLQSALNGNMLEGLDTPIIVKFANPPKARARMEMHENPAKSTLAPPGGQAGPVEAPPSDNLWVGGLPPNIDKAALQALFAPYGNVMDCKPLPPRYEGATSSAMVRFATMEEASWLVSTLNGNIPEGLDQPIIVKFANPPKNNFNQQMQQAAAAFENVQQRSGPYSGGRPSALQATGGCAKGAAKGGYKGASPGSFKNLFQAVSDKFGAIQAPIENQVYISGLPGDTTDHDIYRLFAPFGAISPNGVKAMTHPDGSCRGFGFVDYVESTAASMAVAQLDGFSSDDGTVLRCSIKAPPTKGRGKGGAYVADGMGGMNGGVS